ncbi:MAG: flagellar motor protein MotB [Clostridia bacterium]|jgi:chemotaxis protein MotB|nr:flagellar motor protein MotB [Clostridia bacterium]
MKKIRHEDEPEKENSERWLLTYSDLITLLLALFIILYTMSTIDMVKLQKLSNALNEAFNGNQAFNGTLETPTPESISDYKEGSEEEIQAALAAAETALEETGSVDEIYTELKNYIQENGLGDKVELQNTNTYIRISLKDMFLFVPDSSVMLNQSKPVLTKIETVLAKLYQKIDHITISGHTADPANDGEESSAIAWQLSTQRAVTVLNYLVEKGLPQYRLSIAGYSHFDPIATNETEEGRAKNRRVEITIFKNIPLDTTNTAPTTSDDLEKTESKTTTTDKTTENKTNKYKITESTKTSSD